MFGRLQVGEFCASFTQHGGSGIEERPVPLVERSVDQAFEQLDVRTDVLDALGVGH